MNKFTSILSAILMFLSSNLMATTYYVLNDANEIFLSTIATSSTYSLSGPGKTLTFEAMKNATTAVGTLTPQYSLNGTSWTDLKAITIGELNKNSYKSFSYALPEGVQKIRFQATGSYRKYIKNVKVTMDSYLNVPSSLDLGEVETGEYSLSQFDIDYCNVGSLSISSNNPYILVSLPNLATDGKYGKQSVSVVFSPNSTQDYAGNITITNGSLTKVISVTGKGISTSTSPEGPEGGADGQTYYVLNETSGHSINYYSDNADHTYLLTGPGETFSFQAKKQDAGTHNLFAEYSVDGNDWLLLEEIDINTLTTDYQTFSYSLPLTAKYVRLRATGTLYKYYKDLKVTMAHYLNEPSVSALDFGSVMTNVSASEMPIQSFTIDYCNVGTLTFTTTNTDFVLSPISLATAGKYGTKTVMVAYNPSTAGPASATITISNGNGQTQTVQVSGTGVAPAPQYTTIHVFDDGYVTYYNSQLAYIVPEGVTGYIFEEDHLVPAYSAGDVVPADEALVLKGTPGDCQLQFTTTSDLKIEENLLLGTDVQTALPNDNNYYFYALTTNAAGDLNSIGFYWMNATGAAFTNGAHKAYLKLAKPSNGKAPSRFLFNHPSDATNLETANTSCNDGKFMHNGQLYIRHQGKVYTLAGHIVNNY